MIVAIVHYHLRRGGVTRVIEHALRALPDTVRPVILCGAPPAGETAWPCPVEVVEGLGYDAPVPTRSPDELARSMTDAVRRTMGQPPDLWHVHNHSLGKSAALTGAVSDLAGQGHRFVLQIHDLPEDGRPADYAHLTSHTDCPLYPAAPQIHYATINRRDGALLRGAGLPDPQWHALPNAVWMDAAHDPDPGPVTDLVLYPTRAIRRKNLGEFLFWAASAGPGQRFAVTLAPENPLARRYYDHWVGISCELNLPVTFELGASFSGSFVELVRSAQTVVTTSVAEGFGLAFLEPWLLGRPLVGRNLPDITREFEDTGIQLPGLYPRLDIPLDQIDRPALRARLDAALTACYRAYGRPLPPSATDHALAAMIQNEHVDFGRLDEQEQERVLRHRAGHAGLSPAATVNQVAGNARTIGKEYSLKRYGYRLQTIYTHVLASKPGEVGELNAASILDAFLDPARFNLLRT